MAAVGFARDGSDQLGLARRGNFELDVDPVRERPRNAPAVARDALRRATAAAAGRAAVAARAGVHRRNQLEAGGKLRLARRAHDRYPTRLERLAQRLQHVAIELRQLVEEQHAVMSKRNFPRARHVAAADQRCARRAVVRRAERPCAPAGGIESRARNGLDRRHLQRLGLRKRRQDSGKAGREHRLAGSRRTDHQHAVTPGGGDLQRPLDLLLPLDLVESRDSAAGTAGRRRNTP